MTIDEVLFSLQKKKGASYEFFVFCWSYMDFSCLCPSFSLLISFYISSFNFLLLSGRKEKKRLMVTTLHLW